MSTTTSDTAAIDEKKAETNGTGNSDYTTKLKGFASSVLSITVVLIIYFSSSSLLLYGCKLAQSNILPTESNCYPYTETKPTIKPINTNIFTTFFEPKMSMKMNFPYDEHNSSNKLLSMFREYKNEPKSNFLANYFISIVESLVQFNYSAYNTILNMINGLPETVIMLFGPMIFGIITAIVLLCDNLYLIYLWFANMGWFFKTNTNDTDSGKPKWTDTTWLSPVNYCIAIWLAIIFGFGFLFTMPVFFFLSFLLLVWLVISSLTFKAAMNGKLYSLGTLIKDAFKNHKLLIVLVFSLFVVSSAFSKLGTTPGIFSIITLCLIYFGILRIDLFNPLVNDNLTPVGSFEQATKVCNKTTKISSVVGSALGAAKNFFKGGSNIAKDLKNLHKK